LTPYEEKTLELNLNRSEGILNIYEKLNIPTELPGYKLSNLTLQDRKRVLADFTHVEVLDSLFAEGRGVMVASKNGKGPSKFGIIQGIVGQSDFQTLFEKKRPRLYKVKIIENRDSYNYECFVSNTVKGEIEDIEPHRLRMLPIRDKFHYIGALTFGFSAPKGINVDDIVSQHDYDKETSWQYQENGHWVDFPKGVSTRIENLYSSGSPLFLYTPGNPHLHFSFCTEALSGRCVGAPSFVTHHDQSTRQIIFDDQCPDNMTETDFYTGLQRRVRRVGKKRQPIHRKSFPFDLMDGIDWYDKSPRCGLCNSKKGPFMITECCGRTLCDTEDQYKLGSYERDGQCGRNHRYHSICAHHHNENHECDDWKTCQQCKDDFHPYDYAVKATSQAVSGTQRKYNFDDNVRNDIHPADMPFPTCSECGVYVDTTEESTRTLMMRNMSGGGNVQCTACG
jgi:ribosomal protein L32